jgi:hypothetical protein
MIDGAEYAPAVDRPAARRGRLGDGVETAVDAELAAKAVPLAPDTVLRALAGVSTGDDEVGERPVVRLRIASGHVVEGRLIGVGADHAEEVVVLGCPADRQPPDEAVYLRMSDVVSAGVWHAERYRDVLSGGALALLPSGEPVSRLELRRRFAPAADLPLRLDWDTLPDSASVTANLAALLDALRRAVDAIQVDELGRQAWAGVAAVRAEHRPGAQLTVARGPDGLLVAADLAVALPRGLAGELGRQLNAAL